MSLPDGWRLLSPEDLVLGDKSALVIGPFGSDLKTSDYTSSGVPLVFVRDIRQRHFTSPRAYISEAKAAALKSHVVLPGDVLVTKMGDPPGDASVYTGGTPAVITADCIRLRAAPEFDARYISYALEAPEVRRQITTITRGVAQLKVSLARFRSGVRLPVPALDEQRRIVEILEDHLSRLDAADAALARTAKRTDALVARVMADCYAGPIVALGDLSEIQGGIQKQPSRSPAVNAFPFLRVANVTADGLDLTDVHQIELFPGEIDKYSLTAGDLLVVEGNGSPSQIGRAALWDGSIPECVHQNHLIRVRPRHGLLPEFLEVIWNSPQNRSTLTELSSSSSGLHTLSVGKLKSLSIPLPPPPEQERAVSSVGSAREAAARARAAIGLALGRSASLRRALLAAAFEGRLTGRPRDLDLAAETAEL